MSDSAQTSSPVRPGRWQPDLLYSVLLLAAALAALAVAAPASGLLAGGHGWPTAVFFLVFGLFAIATGFPHPGFGHVSFDRVAQVASILVLGPVDAAWVNGLASFLYPWHRLGLGVPVRQVVTAAVHNSGLMIFVILGPALLYQYLGGPIPLRVLAPDTAILLVLLVIAMQVINDLGMMYMIYLRRGNPRLVFNGFATLVEFLAAAAGVLLVVAYTGDSMAYFVLLLLVFATGMLIIMQYALMRFRLEKLVEARTEELRVQATEFERQATHDKLTGLPNRRFADDYLQKQIDLAQRNDHAGAVALADVDHFKRINDGYSHAIGDRVLERVARLLSEGCRKTDFVARYGGEEFLLYFPDTSADRAKQVCSELRVSIEGADWSDIAPDLRVTISFGLAEIRDDARCTTVLSEADTHLYRAKREGRNRVVAA